MDMNRGKNSARDFGSELDEVREQVLAAMLPEVVFEGWTSEAYALALRNSSIDEPRANLAFPRGALDVAIYFHKAADARMAEELDGRVGDITSISQKVQEAILLRLDIASEELEAVRRAAAVFALPQNAAISAKLVWHTADAIWNAIGDDSKGFTYYTKRSSLSAVYSTSLLYYLSDQSADHQDTANFVERRIHDMGSFSKFTSKFKRKSA